MGGVNEGNSVDIRKFQRCIGISASSAFSAFCEIEFTCDHVFGRTSPKGVSEFETGVGAILGLRFKSGGGQVELHCLRHGPRIEERIWTGGTG